MITKNFLPLKGKLEMRGSMQTIKDNKISMLHTMKVQIKEVKITIINQNIHKIRIITIGNIKIRITKR